MPKGFASYEFDLLYAQSDEDVGHSLKPKPFLGFNASNVKLIDYGLADDAVDSP